MKYEKFVVVAVAGQSNAVGYDESSLVAEDAAHDTDRVKQLGMFGSDNLKIIDLDYCAQNLQNMKAIIVGQCSDGHNGTKGVHLPLANLLLEHIPEDYGVLMIATAFGGTSMIDGSEGSYNEATMLPNEFTYTENDGKLRWNTNGAYYKTLMNRIKFALDMNEKNLFAGVVWVQGENDNDNAAAQPVEFEKLTMQLFYDLRNYGSRTRKGVIDKDIWFNVETVPYFMNLPGCKKIWEHYKEWNAKTYVEISRDALVNETNFCARVPEMHFGQNYYRTHVAPAILKKMQGAGVLWK